MKLSEQAAYLNMLSKQFPTTQAVCTEIINLKAILDLPKGTEHFISDLHGEYEAVKHILNNASGVIREKIDELYSDEMTEGERAEFATLIYYPRLKMACLREKYKGNLNQWYSKTLVRLVEICRVVASKYTRSKVRKALPADFAYIMDELLHADYDEKNKQQYYERIVNTIVDVGTADAFIQAIATLIKRLSVDKLHVVGDIFDRGPGPEDILDMLIDHHSVDITWGNHDLLWMGAAAGNEACIANVLNVSLSYANVDTLENGYGISLRALTVFAEKTYGNSMAFKPKVLEKDKIGLNDVELVAKLRKAAAVMQLKLEGQIIARHPEYDMDCRRLLDKIDYENGTVTIGEKVYILKDKDFPTIDPANPYELTKEEKELISSLKDSFIRSVKLRGHMNFLLNKGTLYRRSNGNLIYHGCVPLTKEGKFDIFTFDGKEYFGKNLFDYCEKMVKQGFNAPTGSQQKQAGLDHMWWLWCGKNSPIFGKTVMTTFERMLIEDKTSHEEPKNPYYKAGENVEMVEMILENFCLSPKEGHIINGHVPVKFKDGESPIKCKGRMLSIDGGFCKAYQSTTGIAGYTLIYNSYGLRLVSHGPFDCIEKAVEENTDIISIVNLLERTEKRMLVSDTDIGAELEGQIFALNTLLKAYQNGEIKEKTKS